MHSTYIDLEQLAKEISKLQRWQPLYKVLKRELTKKGYWCNKPRGNPKLGFKMRGTKKKE